MSESRTLRERHASVREDIDISLDLTPPDGSAALLAMTQTEDVYPTSANRIFACVAVDIDAEEIEGASAAYSPRAGYIYAYNIGSTIPPPDTKVVIHAVGGRWAFRYDGPE